MTSFIEGQRVRLTKACGSLYLPEGAIGTFIGEAKSTIKVVFDDHPCGWTTRAATKHWQLPESYFELVEESVTKFKVGDRVVYIGLHEDEFVPEEFCGVDAVITKVNPDGLWFAADHNPADAWRTDWSGRFLNRLREAEVATTFEADELRGQLAASQKELADFKALVVKIACSYAREHDWCEVVSGALSEMGLAHYVTSEVTVTVTTTISVEHMSDEPMTKSMVMDALVGNGFEDYFVHSFEVGP